MTIYLGADHRGFALKEKLKQALMDESFDVVDLGADEVIPDDDYPVYAAKVVAEVSKDFNLRRGILICGSGFGMDIAADKFPGIRAVLPSTPDHAYQARHDDDANVLAIAADFTDAATALKIAKTFIATPFAGEERYNRRLKEISDSESH